jgi:Zn-dependent M28 family amino/carboxypeptidase
LFVVSSFSLICFAPSVSAETTEESIIAEMIAQMNTTEIYNTVYDLQSFITRRYWTPGNVDAATYIYNRLSNIPGLSVEYQSSYYNNVIATLSGVYETSNAIYIVGAHYDSISSDPNYAPGATDNGVGVAIVLEFARIMSQYSFKHTLKFAFWNDEEDGALGSAEYVKYIASNGIDVSLYMNFDPGCYDPDGRMVLDIVSNQQSSWVSNIMTECNTLYDINFILTYNIYTFVSDHTPFWDYGYPAVTTHSESHGPAHSPQDTVDQVSTVYAQKNGQLGMSVIATLAGVVHNEVPEFTSASAILLTALTASASIILVSAQKKTKALKRALKEN